MQSTVSHPMQSAVQPSPSQLSDRTMQFRVLSKTRKYKHKLGGKYDERVKLPKPEMEKKRRERINASLEMLRHLVAEPILKQMLKERKIDYCTLIYPASHTPRSATSGLVLVLLQFSKAEKLEKADILELTVWYLQSSSNREKIHYNLWILSADTAWTYFLAGYTSCEDNLRQFMNSAIPNYSEVKIAPLITAIESQKFQALYNFLSTINQQTGPSPQPPASNTDINYALASESHRSGKDVVWRPW
ncbi:hypothetical protein ACTXT7_011755 [Hymenolepis weldensis]